MFVKILVTERFSCLFFSEIPIYGTDYNEKEGQEVMNANTPINGGYFLCICHWSFYFQYLLSIKICVDCTFTLLGESISPKCFN